MNQYDLYTGVPPHQTHSDSSHAAAIQILESTDTLRAQLYRFLRDRPEGATDEEMQEALEWNPSTQRPRRVELVALEVVGDSGQRRRTRSRRWAVVWTIAPLGREVLP